MSLIDWTIVVFTIKMALAAVIIDLPPGIMLAWLLTHKTWRGKAIVDTLASLPLVMPPVAVGLILLEVFGRHSPIGQWLDRRGFEVIFSWKAVVVAMAVMSFPFVLRGSRIAFEAVDRRLEEVAATLGATTSEIFFRITVPLAAHGIVAGALMAFTRALGEFGATILVAGNIPGQTTTMATSIYNSILLGRDGQAYAMISIAVAAAFIATYCSELILRRKAL